jgi:hypothetical protein
LYAKRSTTFRPKLTDTSISQEALKLLVKVGVKSLEELLEELREFRVVAKFSMSIAIVATIDHEL